MSNASPLSNAEDKRPILIRNVRLIDGTSDAPRDDVSIVLDNEQIARVNPSAEDSADLDAYQVVDGAGLTAMPGFIDTHGHFEDWMGQLLLNYGVTTLVDVANISPLEWLLVQKEAARHQVTVGPRLLSFGSAIMGTPAPNREFLRAGYPSVRDADEARRFARYEIELGVDGLKAYCNLTDEAMRGITDEAHAAGLPVLAHTNKDADVAARLGIDGIAHGSGIKYAASDRRDDLAAMGADAPYASAPGGIMAWNWIDRARTTEVLRVLVDHGVFLEPDAVHTGGRALHRNAARYREEDIRLFSSSSLQYVPQDYRLTIMEYDHWDSLAPEDFEYAKQGFDRYVEMIREFHDLGGRVLTASGLSINPAGIGLHRELEVLVDAGLSPMEAIKGCTSYAAEFLRQSKHIGTIEAGKSADVLLVRGDPLADISTTQNIEVVVHRGRRVELGFSPWYRNPVPSPPFVWAAHGNPTPHIERLDPAICVAGRETEVRVIGSGFVRNSRLFVNGEQLPLVLDKENQELVATIPAGLLRIGTYQAVVMNPKPAPSGQASNTAYLYGSPSDPTKAF